MQIAKISGLKYSFGYRGVKKATTVRAITDKITAPVKNATIGEKRALIKALGISPENSRTWQSQFEPLGGDIISGEIFPNISVTTKGASPMETMGNVISVELARIRGQLKKTPIESLNL